VNNSDAPITRALMLGATTIEDGESMTFVDNFEFPKAVIDH
jgi:hypothetical protein